MADTVITNAPTVQEIGERIIQGDDEFARLRPYHIVYVFRDKAQKKLMKTVLGTAEVVELLGTRRVAEAHLRVLKRDPHGFDVPPAENQSEESADTLLLLLHLAYRQSYDLMEATLKKFHEIEDAEWEDEEGRGYLKRVKKDG